MILPVSGVCFKMRLWSLLQQMITYRKNAFLNGDAYGYWYIKEEKCIRDAACVDLTSELSSKALLRTIVPCLDKLNVLLLKSVILFMARKEILSKFHQNYKMTKALALRYVLCTFIWAAKWINEKLIIHIFARFTECVVRVISGAAAIYTASAAKFEFNAQFIPLYIQYKPLCMWIQKW